MSEQDQEKFCQSCAKFKRGCQLILPNAKAKSRVWRCEQCIAARKRHAAVKRAAA